MAKPKVQRAGREPRLQGEEFRRPLATGADSGEELKRPAVPPTADGSLRWPGGEPGRGCCFPARPRLHEPAPGTGRPRGDGEDGRVARVGRCARGRGL